MKKFLLAAAIIVSLFGISYGIASAVNNGHVVAHADCGSASTCD